MTLNVMVITVKKNLRVQCIRYLSITFDSNLRWKIYNIINNIVMQLHLSIHKFYKVQKI